MWAASKAKLSLTFRSFHLTAPILSASLNALSESDEKMRTALLLARSALGGCAGLIGGSSERAVGGSSLPSAGYGGKNEFA